MSWPAASVQPRQPNPTNKVQQLVGAGECPEPRDLVAVGVVVQLNEYATGKQVQVDAVFFLPPPGQVAALVIHEHQLSLVGQGVEFS